MHFFILGFFAGLTSIALGHPTSVGHQVDSSDPAFDHGFTRAIVARTNSELADKGGLYGCIQKNWLGGCAYFPPHDGCQNVRVQNPTGGWENELYSVGPDGGTTCYVFAGVDCTAPFYPSHDKPSSDWSITYPGIPQSVDAVRSFKCLA